MKWLGGNGVFSAILISALVAFSSTNTLPPSTPVDNAEKIDLPVVGSYEKLQQLLAEIKIHTRAMYDEFSEPESMAVPTAPAMQDSSKASEAPSEGSRGYSGTNVQVEGVDEADLIKTDGNYIFQVNKGKVVVIKALPATEMRVENIIGFEDESFSPRELYLDEDYLVVIGSTCKPISLFAPENKTVPEIYPSVYSCNTVKAMIFDIQRKTDIKKLREVEIEGNYISSRRIDSSLYFVVNRGLYYHTLEKGAENPTPLYRDTAVDDDFIAISYDDIRYFPRGLKPNYLIIAGVDLGEMNKGVNIYTLLGAGENIYSSWENLYVSLSDSNPVELRPQHTLPDVALTAPLMSEYNVFTQIYKFSLNSGQVSFDAKGEVLGTLLNQFSMDEYNGYFRIATTTGFLWRNDDYTSKNNLYVLDEDLKITGCLEGMAPGEQIYSVRFMGDTGYMVTFKTVDPLFVIDLTDPRKPAILGALKIPGYSDYIHPYDDNHILGFGKDTTEIEQKDLYGNIIGRTAFYQGIKIALFNVKDVRNPVEEFQVKIGDRGTDSELLRNHKALLFSKEKSLLAFPLTLMEVKDNKARAEEVFPRYGQFAFQGAYVYNIDLTKGFVLKGRISHLSDEDYLKAGNYWYDSDKAVQRILYIGDVLYTLSNDIIKANRLSDLKELKSLTLPE